MKLTFHFSKISGQEILDLLIEFAYLAVIFLIPLWFSYWFPTYNIFELNKIILFQILVWLLFLFTILKIILLDFKLVISTWKILKKYWLIPTVFILGLGLITLNSSDLPLSFYGTIERQQGLSSYGLYFLWFILISFNLILIKLQTLGTDQLADKIRRIIMTAVLSASLVALYGVLQIFNIDFLSWPYEPYLTHRTISSLGQPNFLASWLLLVIPLTIYLFWRSRGLIWRFVYFLALIIQGLCFFWTGSRGGAVAIIMTAFGLLIYFLLSSRWSIRKKIFLIVIFVLISLSTIFILDIFSHGRIRELARIDYGSLGARVNLYTAALESLPGHLWLGYGLENIENTFITHYTPDWAIYGTIGQSGDRAHNLILDIWLTTGIFGLLIVFLFYGFFFKLARKNLVDHKNPALVLALAGGVLAYLFSLLFSFSIPTGEIYLWLFLALLIIISLDNPGDKIKTINEETKLDRQSKERKFFLVRTLKIGLVIIAVVIVYYQIDRALKSLMADYYSNRINIVLAERDYFTVLVLADYQRNLQINSVNQESYDLFLGDRLSDFYPPGDELATRKMVAEKLRELDNDLPPIGYKNLFVKAKINKILNNFSVAHGYLQKIIALTPSWPPVYWELGELELKQGKLEASLAAFNSVLANLPSAGDSRLNEEHRQGILNYQYLTFSKIGDIYFFQKDYQRAEEFYRRAHQSNPTDYTILKKIADTYYWRGDKAEAIRLCRHGWQRSPQDYNWPLALYGLYQESGDLKQANFYLNEAKRLSPQPLELK